MRKPTRSRVITSLALVALVICSLFIAFSLGASASSPSSQATKTVQGGNVGTGSRGDNNPVVKPFDSFLEVSLFTNQNPGDASADPDHLLYPIANKNVTVTNMGNTTTGSQVLTLTTNSQGFADVSLPPSNYTVSFLQQPLEVTLGNVTDPVRVTNGNATRVTVTILARAYHAAYSELSSSGNSVYVLLQSPAAIDNTSGVATLKVLGAGNNGTRVINATLLSQQEVGGDHLWLQLQTSGTLNALGTSGLALETFEYTDNITMSPPRSAGLP